MRWSRLAVLCYALACLTVATAQAQVQPAQAIDPAAFMARTDVAEAGDLAGARRVLRFVQVSDAHILDDDAPYPMRQEQLDPYITPFSTSAQRPQDEFTDEVLESIVRAINAQHAADRFQFVMNTGDNIDNDQENELMRFLDLYDGTSTTTGPVSGLACVPDGQSTGTADEAHDVEDRCTSLPESLLADRTALAAGLPWYSAFGNHDALIQGNVNPNDRFDDVAAQHGRHLLTQPEYVGMHFGGSDACRGGSASNDFGHGYGLAGERLCDDDPDNDGYYAFEVGGVRFLVLDTVNDDFVTANEQLQGQFNPQTMTGADVIGGYAEGSIDPAQAAWLDAEVAANPGKLLVAFSHHTVNSMFSNLAAGYCNGSQCLDDLLQDSGYKTGPQLVEELAAVPNFAGWIGGHTHRHRIQPKLAGDGGFWNIESSSLIDWPQQARAIELWVTADGGKGFWLTQSFGHDFQPSKDLELTDPQREPSAEGAPGDQDVLLWFDVPPNVTLAPQPAPFRWEVRPAHVPALEEVDGVAGTPLQLAFEVRDAGGRSLATVDARPTLSVSIEVARGGQALDASVPTLTLAADNASVRVEASFLPEDAGTYVVTVRVATVSYAEGDHATLADHANQTYELRVVAKAGAGNGSPPLPGAAMLGLALAALLARRR